MEFKNLKKLKILVVLFLVITLSGCTDFSKNRSDDIANKENQIFEIEEKQEMESMMTLYVVRHKDTGKRFVIFEGSQKGGIAPLD